MSSPRAQLEDLVIISGLSGAGKSTAMDVFEDSGYFCVDNLPPEMIGSLIELFLHEGSAVRRAAIVCDVRGGDYFATLQGALDDLKKHQVRHRLLFLDADDSSLLRRYKETRRRHPLAPTGTIAEGIAIEHERLDPFRQTADVVIDTSNTTAASLRQRLTAELLPPQAATKLAVTFMSFGFKHTPPRDADSIFDVRFLSNPYWENDLRSLTGRDPQVVEYIAKDGRFAVFIEKFESLLDFLIPQYVAEGKAHLLLAVGCTGGRHRSVAVVEYLLKRYQQDERLHVEALHRDLER